MNLKIESDFIYVTDNRVERLDGAWNNKRKAWRLPNTLGALRELYQMEPMAEIQAYGIEKRQHRDKLLSLKGLDDAEGDSRLRSYQRVDVNYLKRIPHALIGNEQRTGKTPTSLVLAKEMDFKSIVIVCPASLVINWKEECEKWLGEQAQVYVIKGTKGKRQEIYSRSLESGKNNLQESSHKMKQNEKDIETSTKVIILSYETLRNDIQLINKNLKESLLDCLIIDEAHRLRNHKSLQSKAVYSLGKLARHRYALTGTPTVKEGHEIYGILRFLYPEKFPGYWQFVDRYFHVNDGHFGKVIGGYKREEELKEILAGISTSRKRKDVMSWLPEKQYQTIKLEATPKQARVYKDVFETFVHEDKIDAPSVLAQLTRLRQITTCPEVLEIDDVGAKEKFIMEWLEDNPNESVIIFSNFTSYLKILSKKLKGSVLVHGEMSSEEKQQNSERFRKGETRILLANIITGGTGWTWDAATTTIFLDKAYNPSENAQAEDRMIPVSKERNHSCTILSLVIENSIDEKIEQLLAKKEDITKVINSVDWKEFLK